MPSFKRPGVYISESLTPNATVQAGSTTTAVFIGAHHRGPTDRPVLIESWSQFASVFGGFPSTGTPSELPFAVYNYLSNGGRNAYIARVTGAGAAVATVTLSDRAGSPLPSLKVDAKDAGAWGNDIRVSIVDRDGANGRFDLLVYEGGTTDAYLKERWTNLSMVDADDRHVEKIVNSATAGSTLITVTDLDSASAAPTDTPVVAAGTALTGGSNGSAPSTVELTAAVTAGTTLLDQVEGIAAVNMPGISTATVLSALIAYCEERGSFFVVADPPAGQTPAEVVTFSDTLPVSSYAAIYYPWVVVPDPSSNTAGATRTSPPGAFVLGKIAETDTARGVWKAPAGLTTRLVSVIGTERKFTNTELDTLNENHVNAIRQVPGAGVVIMGARTLEGSTSDRYVNVRRTLNYIKDALTRSTEFAQFENNDETLWGLMESVMKRFLGDLHSLGGLKGVTPDQAFYVKCDEELNTPAVIASGQVRAEVGVALQHPAEFIVINIGQWQGGQTATEA